MASFSFLFCLGTIKGGEAGGDMAFCMSDYMGCVVRVLHVDVHVLHVA